MKTRKIVIAILVIVVLVVLYLSYIPLKYRALKSNINDFKKDPDYSKVTDVLKDSIASWKNGNRNNWAQTTYTADGAVLFNEAHDKCDIVYCTEFTRNDTTFLAAANAQGVLKANRWYLADSGNWIEKPKNEFKGQKEDLVKMALKKMIRKGLIKWNMTYNNKFIDSDVKL